MFLVLGHKWGTDHTERIHADGYESAIENAERMNQQGYEMVRITVVVKQWLHAKEVDPFRNIPVSR